MPFGASASVTVTNGARPTPPATIQTSVSASGSVNGLPSGPRHCTLSPGSISKSARVVTPIRLLRMLTPDGAPDESRRISNTENGRRRSGSQPCPGLTITNCPGSVAAAISGAASDTTL